MVTRTYPCPVTARLRVDNMLRSLTLAARSSARNATVALRSEVISCKPSPGASREFITREFSGSVGPDPDDSAAMVGLAGIPVLPHKLSSHNSVTLDVDEITGDYAKNSVSDFGIQLVSSLHAFKTAGKSCCWITVPLDFAHFIPIAAQQGFTFHHAEGKDATLVLWLKHDVASRVPSYATHQVGVGGLVLSGDASVNILDQKVLVVRERQHKHAHKYKLPGGLANAGEDFGAAAAREVFEETGVEANYESLLTLRHWHGASWGRSDIYAIALLRASAADATTKPLVIDEFELEFADWVSVAELRAETSHPMLTSALNAALGDQEGGALPLREEMHASVVPGRKSYTMYFSQPQKPVK